MNSSRDHSIPIHEAAQIPDQTIKRHRTIVRQYAHRVHESLTTRVSKLICTIFLGLLFIVGVISFILWLSLRPHRPRFHIHEFSVPGLAQESGFENAVIRFNATARNPNQSIGIKYDTMDGAVYYRDQKIGLTPLITEGFYEEPKSTRIVVGEFGGATLTVNSQRWMEFMEDRKRGAVMFRLELTSTIQFRISSWESKRHRMHANCEVDVGPDGLILPASTDKRCPVYFS